MGGEFPADRASQEEWEIPLAGYLFSLGSIHSFPASISGSASCGPTH